MRPVLAQSGQPLTTTKIADKFTLIGGAGINVIAVDGADGLLVVDGGLAEHRAGVLKALGAKPVQVLFNTHWHPEVTGLNAAAGEAGAKIVSHENTRLWLGAEIIVKWQNNRAYDPLPKTARPNDTFYATGKLTFGDEPVEYGYMLQAHTDGDAYVFFPRANVLAGGDVLSVGRYPILDYSTGGWVGGLSDGLKTLLKVANKDTKIVPGYGPVMTYGDLEAHSEVFAKCREILVGLIRKGLGPKEMVAAPPLKEFDAMFGDPELFISNAYWGLWGHVREIGGIV